MKTVISIAFSILLFSCGSSTKNPQNDNSRDEETHTSQEFIDMDSSEFNKKLAQQNEKLTAMEVMQLFYPREASTGEGNEKITISEQTLDSGIVKVTLIHANLLDDSVRDIKYVMELQENKTTWTVRSLKQSFRCWEGRGHTDWGADLCR